MVGQAGFDEATGLVRRRARRTRAKPVDVGGGAPPEGPAPRTERALRQGPSSLAPPYPPHEPAAVTPSVRAALRALAAGAASGHQQQAALRWITEAASQTYDRTYRPGDATASAFAEGRRFVGLQIVQAINGVFEEEEKA